MLVTYHKIASHHTCYFMEIADYGVDNYDIGSGFGHFGVAVEDVSHFFKR